MIRFLMLLPFCFFLCHPNAGQGFDASKMDELFDRIEEAERGMGSISVFRSGQEVYQRAFGYADIANKTKPDAQTQYRIGSITKTFTSVIIMRLIEAGELTLDTSLDQFFPEVQNASAITIELLLRHRSGIFNMTNAKDYHRWENDEISREKILKKIVKYGSAFEPDTKAEYSNSNFVLLTLIAERLTGKTYDDLVGEIALDCGLTRTEVGGKISGNQALSYNKSGEWKLARETDMSVPLGAGAIISTPTDLNRFLRSLFFDGKLVSDKSLQQMKKMVDGFGLGLLQAPFYDKKAFGHTGGIDGFRSTAFYFPADEVSVSYTANGEVMPANNILIGVLSIYFGRTYDLPNFADAIAVTSEQLDQYLGVYSGSNFPLKITITKKGNELIGQATGQPSFPLEAYEEHKFRFEQAGLTMEFLPDENKMMFKQGGGTFKLAKE